MLNIGDELLFLKRPNDDESISVTITGLKRFDSFEELVNFYDMERLYLPEYTKEMFLNELLRFYSIEDQKKDGVLAIEFRK